MNAPAAGSQGRAMAICVLVVEGPAEELVAYTWLAAVAAVTGIFGQDLVAVV